MYCVLFVAGTNNVNGNNNDSRTIFTITDKKLYVTVLPLLARVNQT